MLHDTTRPPFVARLRPWLLAVLATVLGMSGLTASAAAPFEDDETLVPPTDEVVTALVAGDVETALTALEALGTADPERLDAWTVYRADALLRLDRARDARALLEGFEERFDASPWRAKARFLRAEAARRSGDDAAAAAIARDEARLLRGTQRRDVLGAIYLDAAAEIERRAAATPSDTQRASLRSSAAALLENAVRLETSPEVRGRIVEARARLALASRSWAQVATWFTRLAEESALDPRSALVIDARLAAGRARLVSGDANAARIAFEDLVRDLSARIDEGDGAPWLRDARWSAEAGLGDAWSAAGETQLALTAWQRLVAERPRHAESARVRDAIARSYEGAGRTDEALAALAALESMPDPEPLHANREIARALWVARPGTTRVENDAQGLARRAAALRREALYRSAEALRRAARFDEALAVYRDYVNRHPGSELWSDAQAGIATSSFERAMAMLETTQGDVAAADAALGAFVETYPLDGRRTEALFARARLPKQAAESWLDDPADRRAAWQDAAGRLEELGDRLGDSEGARGLYEAAEILELQLELSEEAAELYRRVPAGHFGNMALLRLQAMEEVELTIRAPRLARVGEAVPLELWLRNVPEVEIQVVALDLEAYFQRHGTHLGVADLDLDLIAADVIETRAVEDYQRYAKLKRTIEVPVGEGSGPGVWAVSVLAGGDRATTLVVRSDLDVIVKRSRREVFAFVTELSAEGEPEPVAGAEVTVSFEVAGVRRQETVTTDAGGVARLVAEEGEAFGDDTRVFAARGANVAAVELTGSAGATAEPLQDRAVLYTDRPLYRAGETVHFRAVLRRAVDGAWALPEETAGYRVELVAPSGVAVARVADLELSSFGTLEGSFELDPSAGPGSWAVRAVGPDAAFAAQATVRVGEFDVPRVMLDVESDRGTVLRGQPARFTAIARTGWGAPLADTAVVWTRPDGVEERVTTDADGTATLAVETERYVLPTTLDVRATLPTEGGVSASARVRIATVGLELELSADRDVALAGSVFNVNVVASAPGGEGVAAEFELTAVTKFETRPGRYGEETEVQRTVTTDASGRATVPISLVRGGQVTLRIGGRDPFGQLVEATATLFVSSASDAELLRLLADDTDVLVGESPAFTVMDRSGGGLALLTFEGSTILEHRVVRLVGGANQMTFEALGIHVPDVVVSASAIRTKPDRPPVLHTSTATYVVSRPLTLVVGAPAKVAPSGEVTVELRATDGLGSPVQAEVSLALVDEALFQLAGDAGPRLAASFAGRASRTPAFVTAASATFRYRGVTRQISGAVLLEAQREEAAEQFQSIRGRVEQTLGDFEEMESLGQVTLERLEAAAAFAPEPSNDLIGLGGGSGGKFGSRFGGKRSLNAAGGAGRRMGAPPAPTAYWNGRIVTGADGRASVTIPMPGRETTWRVTAAGVSADHRYGDARAAITASAPYVVSSGVPSLVRAGDRPRVRTQLIAEEPVEADTAVLLELRAERAGRTIVQNRSLTLAAGSTRVAGTFDALDPLEEGSAPLVLTVTAKIGAGDGALEVVERTDVSVRPAGYVVVDTAAGRTRDVESVELELPVGAEARSVELLLGASPAAWLVDEALRGSPIARSGGLRAPGCRVLPGPAEQAAELFGAAALLDAAGSSGGLDEGRARALRERCRGLVAALSQRAASVVGNGPERSGQGAWVWGARGGTEADHDATARCVVALAEARRSGLQVTPEVLGGAARALEEGFSQVEDRLVRARMLWALACLDRSNEVALNRMHRERRLASVEAACALACALFESDRIPMAREVAEMLGDLEPGSLRGATGELERRALRALARATAGLDATADLAALRAARPWFGSLGRGTAIAAMARGGALESAAESPVVVTWTIGERSETVTLDGRRPVARIESEIEDSAPRTVKLGLKVVSGPPLDWSALASGVSPDVPEPAPGFGANDAATRVVAATPRWRGHALDDGFDVVDAPDGRSWRNEVTELPFGESARVQFSYRVPRREGERTWPVPLEVEIPLPAGVVARPDDGSGVELVGGSLILPVPAGSTSVTATVEIIGVAPGTWTLAPSVVRSANDPADVAYGSPGRLVVLAPGEASSDDYRPTPDERLSRGRRAFADGDRAATREALRPLYDRWRRELEPRALAETARLLLFASLAHGDEAATAGPNEIVDWFEVLKERDPDLFVSFEDTLQVADAYGTIGEHERALVLFRAIIDETFGEDMRVAQALDDQGEWVRATRMLNSIWARYPSSPRTKDADLALAARLIQRGLSDEAFPGASAETRSGLIVGGIARLRRMLALGEADDLARADAGLALVSAYVGLEDWERARDRAALLGGAFKDDPTYADSFRYTEAVSRWNLGEDDAATELLQAIADATYRQPDGRALRSENRDLALYILAQIHHAARDPERAAEYYERVEDAFAGARWSLAELRAERLEFDEDVVRVKPGEDALLGFEHKGVDALEVLVFPVDLMTLALRERDLSSVTAVDLAGVTPTVSRPFPLERSTLRTARAEAAIALQDPGAYLVMARAGAVHRSALVLVTDLELEVAVDGLGGVRAQLFEGEQAAFRRGASVRVLGNREAEIASGETDARGLFTADGFGAGVTVIARADGGHYAFHSTPHASGMQTDDPADGANKAERKLEYFKNVLEFNDSNVDTRRKNFDIDVKRDRKGIQVQQAR